MNHRKYIAEINKYLVVACGSSLVTRQRALLLWPEKGTWIYINGLVSDSIWTLSSPVLHDTPKCYWFTFFIHSLCASTEKLRKGWFIVSSPDLGHSQGISKYAFWLLCSMYGECMNCGLCIRLICSLYAFACARAHLKWKKCMIASARAQLKINFSCVCKVNFESPGADGHTFKHMLKC